MKILFVVSTLRRSGPTRQLLNLVRGLTSKGESVTVCTLSPEPDGSMIEEFEREDVVLESFSLGRIVGFLVGKSRLLQLVSRLQPDVIHSQGVRADSIVSDLHGWSRLCTQRNDPFEDYLPKFGRWIGRIMAFKHIRVLKRMPMVVSCSVAIKQALEAYGVQSRAINNGVDTLHFRPLEPQGENNQTGRLRAVVIGELSSRKDPLTVLKGMASNRSDSWQVSFVGDGPLRVECEEFVQKNKLNDVVSFEGLVNDVRPYLANADVQISASHSEGYPNALLEGLACGVPPLLSDIQPHCEVMQQQPDYAAFFKVGDAVGLGKALCDFKQVDKSHVRAYAEQWLSAERMVSEYLALYQVLKSQGIK